MPKYAVIILPTAQKQLDKLDDHLALPIIKTIHSLAENPRLPGYKKLRGRPGYRIRKGDYRIIYDIHDKILTIDIIAIGDRKDIYD
jgi:mRNA interferase RelE/StbE